MKTQYLERGILLHFAILIFSLTTSYLAFSQQTISDKKISVDKTTDDLINDFIDACNSGDRIVMTDFVLRNYDPKSIQRIPLFALVSLNLSFYYETGGLGYELIETLPSTSNSVSAIFFNKLTKTKTKIKIPVTESTPIRINRFIKSEPIYNENNTFQINDNEIVNKLDLCLNKMTNDEEFSGAILLAKNGKIILDKAIGEANKEYNIPNNTDTKFNIASVGKIFTAMAIIQLVEHGKLSFDDPISKYVPKEWLSLNVSERIQIKHLLTHTSGLGDYFKEAYEQCEVPFFRDLNDYKSLISKDTLMFEPGTKFSYSNTGFILLGVIIEHVSEMGYFEYLKQNIFEPAGMKNTDGYSKDYTIKKRATGYTKVYEKDKIKWNNHHFTRIMRGSPSGGIYSTTHDLFKFANSLRSKKIISPKYYEILMKGRPELNSDFHSYGFFVSKSSAGNVAGHKGDGRGMNSHFKMYLDSGYTVVILSNYSAPSANIIANVMDQLISHTITTNN